jgi:hypothetical protein
MNAEYLLGAALDGNGVRELEKIHIAGSYDGGDFTTSAPFELSMRHVDAVGVLQITDAKMTARIDMVLRGTAPEPAPVSLTLRPTGAREYSLSQIMMNFDPDYFREFTKTHDKF